jgi:Ser/Thr protein kinase RdoA (MazF antagonist)
MKDFDDLTTRGKALRLRRLAHNALEQYSLPVTRIRLITNETNGVFRVDTADGEKYVIRVGLPGRRSLAQVRSETMWMDAIRRETNLLVPAPEPNRQGEFVTTASAPGVPEPRLCVVTRWISGIDIQDNLTPANIEKWGAFIGQLHQHGANFNSPPDFEIGCYDRVFPYEKPVLFAPENEDIVTPSRREMVKMVEGYVVEAIDRLKANGELMIVTHGDMHGWNAMVSRGRIAAIDFEDLIWAWPIQDVGVTLYYYRRRDNYQEIRDAFKQGYESVWPWPERYPNELETFIAARILVFANDVLSTPAFRVEADEFFEYFDARLEVFQEVIL